MKIKNVLMGALFSSLLVCPPALAKFYLENQTNTSLQIGFVTLRGEQIRGDGWYTLRPGEDRTIEGNDYRENKRYFLVVKDQSSGKYLRFGYGNLCGDHCLAEYADSDVYIPRRDFDIGFNNSYVANQLRSGYWSAFQEYVSNTVRYSGVYIQPSINCYDSSKLYITGISGNTASLNMRVWDRASRIWACGN